MPLCGNIALLVPSILSSSQLNHLNQVLWPTRVINPDAITTFRSCCVRSWLQTPDAPALISTAAQIVAGSWPKLNSRWFWLDSLDMPPVVQR